MGVAALELLSLEVGPAAGKLEESAAHLLWSGGERGCRAVGWPHPSPVPARKA